MNLKNKPQQRVAWVQLGYMALSFVLSYIAGRLLAKKTGLKVDDDKPTAYESGFPTSAGEDLTDS